MEQSIQALLENLSQQVKKQGEFPAGHYHSPIPSKEDILSYVRSKTSTTIDLPGIDLPGIDLNEKNQFDTLCQYTKFYQELTFPEKQTPAHRYYYSNSFFGHSDAIFLYCFLRKHTPRRIIEIGSGFSSAVMLDTIDCFLSQRPEVTFVEPYPDRLLNLLRDSDKQKVNLIHKQVQSVSPEVFLSLESGDFLFIDSSHVVKTGSDLHFIFFHILPRLKPGVFVHFHDVFFPFDYPSNWLTEGRYWNENYFLRAFLSYNSEWSIWFFNHYAHIAFGNIIRKEMPLCAKCLGGSLYIQRNL